MQHRLHITMMLAALCACNGMDPMVDDFRGPDILEVVATKGEDYSQLVLSCRVSSGERIQECGFYFGEDEMVREVSETPLKDNEFSLTVTGLAYSSEYQYEAFIASGSLEVSSEIKTWKTEDEIPPIPIITGIGDGGILAIWGEVPDYKKVVRKDAFEIGVCYSQDNTEPNIDGPHKSGEIKSNGGHYYTFSLAISGLKNRVFLRPYTKIDPVVTYGETRFYDMLLRD